MAGRRFFLFSCILLAFPFSAKADENLVELVKKTKPAVVLIQTFDDNNQPIGQGSGFFVNNKGHIVTNHHVLEGAYRATVKTSSGIEYPVEGIISKNAEADIVKLVANIPAANITFLNLSEIVPSEGQDIVVIGNPLGLESTVSSGIVSAVRDIPAFGKIIQITAPVSPGSSGSPVVNMKGEVIGIATLIMEKGQNLNFAVPSDKLLTLEEYGSQKNLADYAAAIRRCRNILEDSNGYFAWMDCGFAYWKYDLYEESVKAFKKAIAIEASSTAYSSLGLSYDRIGRYSEAIEAYRQAINIEPNDGKQYSNLGDIYEKIGRHDDAMEAYKQSIQAFNQEIKIKSDDSFKLGCLYEGLGDVYGKLTRYDEAIKAYKQAIQLQPFVLAHYNLGLAYVKLGRYTEAADAFKQAIKLRPDFERAHYDLGETYLKLDDPSSALKEYKILKTLDTELANKLFSEIYK